MKAYFDLNTLKISQVKDTISAYKISQHKLWVQGQFKIQMLLYKGLPFNVVQWG